MPRPASAPWASLVRCSAQRLARPTPQVRRINITATTASTEPVSDQPVASSPSAVLALSPGMFPGQCACCETNCARCTLRGCRLALLAPVRLAGRLPAALHPPRNPRRPQRQLGEHPFDPILPRAFQTRPRRHSLLVPKDLFH